MDFPSSLLVNRDIGTNEGHHDICAVEDPDSLSGCQFVFFEYFLDTVCRQCTHQHPRYRALIKNRNSNLDNIVFNRTVHKYAGDHWFAGL